MRVLVTGSSGHLGEALVRRMRGDGTEVVGLDLLPSPHTTVVGPAVVRRLFPECDALYARLGWKLFESIERVYVNEAARRELGWSPRHDFAQALVRLEAGEDPWSALSAVVGAKGYHAVATYPYTEG
jgi:nucleoside-diphosphate-sugar epimerase